VLAQRWLAEAGPACRWLGQRDVASLRREAGRWQAFDQRGDLIACAPVLVLANGDGAGALLDPAAWPCNAVRGQLSVLDAPARHGIDLPQRPLTGAGYLLPAVDGRAVFGATSQPDDPDPSVRRVDHRLNLERLALLSPALAEPVARVPEVALQGRTAWRSVSPDRLPLIGEVPAAWLAGMTQGPGLAAVLTEALAQGPIDQPRRVPRVPGLYLFAGLGSRGITVAALGGELLASLMGGAPLPLGADLVDAVDPARFLTRATRRAAAGRGLAGEWDATKRSG
jgi:tRNA 5-methylaminomethyl-2-thiouridine biosynthesis bifunctional protein